jgi:Undecaprenyl-phosphate galactose phosphotransferase WbaP
MLLLMKRILIQKYSLIVADIVAVILCYYLATLVSNIFRGDHFHQINLHHLPGLKVLDLTIMLSLMWQKQVYFKRRPNWEDLRITYRALITVLLINLPLLFLKSNQAGLLQIFIIFWCGLFILIPCLRSLTKLFLHYLGLWQRDGYIIGVNQNAVDAYLLLQPSTLLGYKICGFVDLKLRPGEHSLIHTMPLPILAVSELLLQDAAAEIIICLDNKTLAHHTKLINQLQQHFLAVSILPELEGLPLYGIEVNHFFGNEQLLLRLENNLSSRFNRLVKYSFDLIIALGLIVPFLLLFLIITLLIFIEDRGAPFFIQERLGGNGRKFKCIKFRTMHKNAETLLEQWRLSNNQLYLSYINNNFKLEHDPRITRVGRVLRRTSMDELPQILNVLIGQMSLVGPRPLLNREVKDYSAGLFYYHQVRPGISGLWQISGRSKTSFKDRARLDTWYVKNWTLWYDVVILIKTVQAVLLRNGAY